MAENEDGGGGGGIAGFMAKFILIPQRILMALMGFAGIANCYFMRQAVSVSITRMIIPINKTKTESAGAICPKDTSSKPKPPTKDQENAVQFAWTENQQGWVLGSFYIGYLLTHMPAGILADKFGGKWVLALGLFVSLLFTLATPFITIAGGYNALFASRIIVGAGQGVAFPALSTMLAAWVPMEERGILGSLVMGGGQVGSMLGNKLSGLILESFPWPMVYYFWGTSCLIWFVFFILLCYNGPESHPFIKEKEKLFLREKIGQHKRESAPPTPWKDICTSVPMWALLAAQLGHDWGLFIIAADLPKYMNDILQFSMKHIGNYASIPYVLMWILSVIAGFVTDCIIRREIMTVLNIRKVNTSIAAFGPAIFMMAASYAGCAKMIVVFCFVICMGTMGPYFSGMKLTSLDLSPNYAGTLMAITNGLGSLCGLFAPVSVGWMVDSKNPTLAEWRMVFWLAFAWLVITCIIYDIWASADVQPWNEGATQKEEGAAAAAAKK